MRTFLLLALAALATLALACGAGKPSDGNLLSNPGFEDGDLGAPWFSLEEPAWGAPFSVSDRQARDGERSALLELRADDAPTRVVGVVQELSPEGMPEVLSGSYYVERWQPGTPKQYLQAVVIVGDAENAPEGLGSDNHQLRYLLAGVDEPPLQIGNARYVIVGSAPPEAGRWQPFAVDLHADFERLWGAVPVGFERLRVLLEVRWDDRAELDGASAADVYYDDLYLGPR